MPTIDIMSIVALRQARPIMDTIGPLGLARATMGIFALGQDRITIGPLGQARPTMGPLGQARPTMDTMGTYMGAHYGVWALWVH